MSMQLIAINVSTGRSLRRTSHTLDLWLPRIGPHTWAGQLSKEGLNELETALKSIATRQTCVSLIWVHQHRFEVIRHIGTAPKSDGVWMRVGSTANGAAHASRMPIHGRYIQAIACLGALFHDTGKATEETQLVYHTQDPSHEAARHEIISGVLLRDFFQTLDPVTWQRQPPSRAIWIRDYAEWPEDPLERIAFQAVISHHGLPQSASNKAFVFKKRAPHATSGTVNTTRLQDHSALSPRWVTRCQTALQNLTHDGISFQEWLASHAEAEPYIYFVTRLLVMLSDAAESAFESDDELQKERFNGRILYSAMEAADLESAVTYAKSTRDVHLSDHLTGVYDYTRKAAHFLFCSPQPRVKRKPRVLTQQLPDKHSRFYWQNHARYEIKRHMSEKPMIQGFFGCMTAQTGSGKTQAGYLFMSALSNDNPRFTLALGQGALAVQQGVEYRERIGLSHEELAIAVGQRFQPLLKDAVHNSGSDMLHDIDEFTQLVDASPGLVREARNDMFKALFKSKRQQAFLDTPVVVMTIDHLIGAMHPNRGSFIPAALRVATTDLIIDEVDAFSTEGLHAIGRLVYVAGLFGRKVLISSATLPPELASGLHSMYRKGYAAYQSATDAPAYVCGLFNDSENTGYAKLVNSEELVGPKSYEAFFSDFHGALSPGTVKDKASSVVLTRRKLQMVHLNDTLLDVVRHDKEGLFPTLAYELLTTATDMADRHHTLVERDDHCVSFGFIRLNSVRNLIQTGLALTNILKETEGISSGWQIKIQFLHSRMDWKVRTQIQNALHSVLKRDHETEWYEHFKSFHQAKPGSKTLVIVLCSPVIEIGLDYDFDWCILEPSSDMSIIQASGRILRHRYLKSATTANVGLLDVTLRSLTHRQHREGIHRFYAPREAGIASLVVDQVVNAIPKSPAKMADTFFGASRTEDIYDGSVESIYVKPRNANDDRMTYYEGIHSYYRLGNSPLTHADELSREVLRQLFTATSSTPGGVLMPRSKGLGAFLSEQNPLTTDRFLGISLRGGDQSKRVYEFAPNGPHRFKTMQVAHSGVDFNVETVGLPDAMLFFSRHTSQSAFHVEMYAQPTFFHPLIGAW